MGKMGIPLRAMSSSNSSNNNNNNEDGDNNSNNNNNGPKSKIIINTKKVRENERTNVQSDEYVNSKSQRYLFGSIMAYGDHMKRLEVSNLIYG